MPPVAIRHFGAVNGRGLWTLYRRELVRFLRYSWESLGGPAVSSLLFLAVFVLAFGPAVGGADFARFVAPGIAMFALVQSAFEYGAMPIVHDKYEGVIQDVLMAPLTPLELLAGYGLAGATCGLLTGLFVTGLMALFVDLPLSHPAMALGFAAAGAVLFALVGVLVGLWAERWDHYSAAASFLVLPLGVLSGAFFSLESVPAVGRGLIELNPVFYAVDGFRYGIIGQAESDPALGIALLVLLDLILAVLAWRLIAVGYKLKP
jgi:ABC-2 type transport system permease protein